MTEPSIGMSQIKTLFHEEIVHYIVWHTVSWTFFQVFLFGVYVTVLTHFSMFANILKMSQNCNTAFYEWSADQNKILSKLSTAVSSVGSGKSDSGYQHCNARQTAPGTRSENFWEMVLYCYLVGITGYTFWYVSVTQCQRWQTRLFDIKNMDLNAYVCFCSLCSDWILALETQH